MSGSDKTVKVTLVAQTAPYARGMGDAASATRKLGSEIDGVSAKQKGFAGSAGQATSALKGMALAGGVVAGTALVGFLTDSVKAAGDLQQSIGGVDAVFKESAARIHEFGENSAEAVGLSRNEFNSLITVTGAMLKNKGLEDFEQKSIDLIKVGADLAATYGGSAKDAVEALNAAMRGESDPIERYGISLNETAVNAELAAKGMNGLTGAALDQAKAQARIDIITRQSADALGAFAREADTLQGQQQRLNAEWEDAKASLGQALLPALTSVMSALRDGVDVALAAAAAFDQIPGPVKAAVTALVALHLLRGPLAGFAGAVSGQVKAITTGLRTMTAGAAAARAGMSLLSLAGGPVGLAITGITAALGGFIQAQQNARQAAEDLAATLDKQSGAFTEATSKSLLDKFFGDFSESDYSKVKKALEDAGVGVSDLIAAYQKGGPAVDDFKRKFDAFTASQQNLDGSTPQFAGNIEALGNAYAALGRDTDAARVVAAEQADAQVKVATATASSTKVVAAAAPAIDKVAIAERAMAEAADAAAAAHQQLAQAMLEITNAASGADAAESAYEQTLDDLTAAIKKNGQTVNSQRTELDLGSEAGRANGAVLRSLRDDALAMAEANLRNGDSVKSVKVKMAEARAEFIEGARRMGLNKAAAKALADEYGLTEVSVDNLKGAMGEIPKETKSRVTVETAGASMAIAGIRALLRAIPDETVKVNVVGAGAYDASRVRSQQRVGFASGGFISGPGTATSDSIPALLSNGEYVLKAAAVAKYGKRNLDELNAMRFAQGGFVSRMPMPAAGSSIDYDRLASSLAAGPTQNIYGLTTEQVRQGVAAANRDELFRRSRS